MDPLDPIPSDPNPPPALPLSTKGADRRPPRPLAHQSRPPNQQRHAHPDPHLDTTAPSARSRPPGSARRPPATPDPQTPRASPTLPHRAASAVLREKPTSQQSTDREPPSHSHPIGTRSRSRTTPLPANHSLNHPGHPHPHPPAYPARPTRPDDRARQPDPPAPRRFYRFTEKPYQLAKH